MTARTKYLGGRVYVRSSPVVRPPSLLPCSISPVGLDVHAMTGVAGILAAHPGLACWKDGVLCLVGALQLLLSYESMSQIHVLSWAICSPLIQAQCA